MKPVYLLFVAAAVGFALGFAAFPLAREAWRMVE